MAMTELEQSLTGPGRAVRDRRGRDPGRDHAGLEDGAGVAARHLGGEQGPRATRLPRLRRRALQLRPSAHPGGQPRPAAHRAVRDRPGRPDRHRHAELPRVGAVVLGHGVDRGRRGAAQRLVDRAGAGLRPVRLGGEAAHRGPRAAGTARRGPRRARPRRRGGGPERGAPARRHRLPRAAGRPRRRRLPARGGHRPGRRRHHPLHVGHHRAAQGRGRHPPQHHQLPDGRLLPGDGPGGGRRGRAGRGSAGRDATAPTDPADLPAVPRRGTAVAPHPLHGLRRHVGADVPVGRRSGGRPDRARGDHQLLRGPAHRVRPARSRRGARRLPGQPPGARVGRHPGPSRAGAPRGRAVRLPGRTRERLRPHGDHRGHGREHGHRLRGPGRQRRQGDRPGRRRALRRARR